MCSATFESLLQIDVARVFLTIFSPILTHSHKLFRKSVCVFSFTLCLLSGIILDGTNKHSMLYFR